MSACIEPGCTAPAKAARLCSRHYQQRRLDQMPKCGAVDCQRKASARGLCSTHYGHATGRHKPKPPANPKQPRADRNPIRTAYRNGDMAALVDSLLAKTRRDGDCLIWTHSVKDSGYGRLMLDGKLFAAHRLMYIAAYDEDPISVHHVCTRGDCINPGHLQGVTSEQNTAEMLERNAYLAEIKSLRARIAELENGRL